MDDVNEGLALNTEEGVGEVVEGGGEARGLSAVEGGFDPVGRAVHRAEVPTVELIGWGTSPDHGEQSEPLRLAHTQFDHDVLHRREQPTALRRLDVGTHGEGADVLMMVGQELLVNNSVVSSWSTSSVGRVIPIGSCS